MKKMIVFIMLLSLVLVIPSAAFANNISPKEAAAYCAANDNLGFQNQGQCVRYLRVCYGPGNTGPLCVCNGFLLERPQDFYDMYNNIGHCISHLRGEVEPE
jgi:hypothetical protein